MMVLTLRKSTFTTLAATVSLAGFIVLAAVRLLQVDASLRESMGQNFLWHVSQTQYQAALLGESLARVAAGDQPSIEAQKPAHLLVILASRIDFLLEGPSRRALEGTLSFEDLVEIHHDLLSAEPAVERGLNRDEALALHVQITSLHKMLRDASNLLILQQRAQNAATRDLYHEVVLESLAAVLGILVSSMVLLLRLFRGIRETRRAERLLRQEQELSNLVVNLSNQGIVIFDRDLRCLLWNPGMEALFDHQASEIVGRPLVGASLFDHADVKAGMIRAIQGESSVVEDEGLCPSHPKRCLEISFHPLRMAERNLAIAFMRDVTERWQERRNAALQTVDLERKVKQRTAALQQAERRLVAAIKTAPDGFAAFDAEGNLLMANERIRLLEPVAGCYREDLSLSAFLACFATCEGADQRLLSVQLPIEPLKLDLRIGPDSWAHLSVTQADGGTIFVRLTDVTPYKNAALALQSALDREREITSAYRRFVSMVSHQFRTPLAIVDSSAQRLLRRGRDVPHEEIASRIEKIRSAITRLTFLVESVLNAAKLDYGQLELNRSPCDLVKVIRGICEGQQELNKQVEIRMIAPPHPVEVSCDVMLIEQVVANLLSNAVKYSGASSIVEVRIGTEGGGAVCSVRDWGIGIPADELPKVFDRFYRASTAAGIAGTGIGLDVARQIVQMHGGDIRVESREAEGSVFTFTLPLTSTVQAPQAA